VRQDIASAVWRAYSQLAYAARNIDVYGTQIPATPVAKAEKFPPFLRKIFNDNPQFFARFQ